MPRKVEEGLRDLVRAREDISPPEQVPAAARSPLLAVDAGATPPALIGQQHFEDLPSRLTCVDYLEAVRALIARRERLEAAIAEACRAPPFAETARRLRCFRGIHTLSAIGLCTEVGDFSRLEKPAKLSAFLGIVPAEYTTDSRRRLGSITKAGSSHARRLLVEAAWHYRRHPRVGETLERRQRGVDARVIEIAWRCPQRLFERQRTLRVERGKPAGVVTIAWARELACVLWETATLD